MNLLKRLTLLFIVLFPSLLKGENPQSIISLSPLITEEIYLLGLGDRIIANTIFCVRPKEAEKKEKVGSLIRVSLEKILKLKPEIVFASPFIDSKIVEKLKKAGIKVFVFPHQRNFDEVCEEFLRLAKILNREKIAKEIVLSANKRLEELKKENEITRKPRVFFQIGTKPLFSATRDSIIHSFVSYIGAENIARDAKTGFFSREEVIKANPDFIIIVTMGMEGEAERKSWMRFKDLKAVRERHIYLMDSYKLCSPNPVTYVEATGELINILYRKEEK